MVLLWAALLWNGYARAGCGPIPNTYPLYGATSLDPGSGANMINGNNITGSGNALQTSGVMTTVSQTLPDISPSTFPANASVTNTNAASIAAGNYATISKPGGGATTFTGGTYNIKTLGSNDDNWTITMAPGDYFVDTINLHDNNTFVVSPAGVVRIYVKTALTGHNQMTFNNGGTTSNMQIFLYPGATATFNDKTIFNGLLYGPGASTTISFHDSDNSHTITGAVISGGTLTFHKDAVINYNAATQAAIGAISTCGGVSASSSTVAASPKNIPADNITTSTITVTLKDGFGTPVSGKTVTLTAGSGSSTISAASGPSDASGVVTFTVRNAVAQSVVYTAADTTDSITITQKATVTFSPSASASTVVASPTSVPADNVTTSTITVTLKDGVGNPVSGKSVTLTAGSGSSTITPASGSTNLSGIATFTVKDAVVESVTYTAKDTTDNVTITQTATVSFTPVVASFNVVEPAGDPVTGKIFTKIAGQNFVLDIVARTAANAVATGFTGTVTVEVVDNSGGGACSGLPLIATLTNQVFAAGDAGRHALTSPNTAADVYRNAVVRVKFPTSSPTVISCSTDNFAIRPASLSFLVQDANRTTAGTVNTLNNTSIPGSPATVHNAGRPFSITATGYNGAASPVITANYNGTPTAVLTTCAGTACTATTGNLSLGTWSASSGTVTTSTATYDDVGAFTLQLQDATFAAVDSADGTSAAQLTISSTAAGVGRFVPDRFLLSAASLVPRSDIAACSGSSFTYMGERMDANFTLTAVGFPSGTTTRYTGTLARLVLTSPGSFSFGAIDSAAPTVLGARLDTSLGSSGTWSNGVAAVVAVLSVTRNASPDGPYNSFKLGIAPSDPDSVVLDPAAINLDADNSGSNERAQIAATSIYFGRLRLQNAYGSQVLSLPIPVQAQNWNGSGFITNTFDSCTPIAVSNVAIGNPQPAAFTVGAPSVTAINAGVGILRLPASSARGSVDVSVNLTAGSTGASCTAGMPASTGATKAYLQGLWCTPPGTNASDPTAHATFGAYRNAAQFIYQRENY